MRASFSQQCRLKDICAQRDEVNWVPLSLEISNGTPYLATQWNKKAEHTV